MNKINFEKNELSIYNHLLERGPLTAIELSKTLNFSRMAVYNIMNKLIEKGLVKKKNNIYCAQDLNILLDEIIHLEDQVIKRKNELNELIEKHSKVKIKIYRAMSGLKSLNKELRKEPVDRGYIIVNKDFLPKELDSRRSREKYINNLTIYFSNKEIRNENKKGNITINYDRQKSFAALSIFGKRVALYSVPEKEEAYGLIINDENFSNLLIDLLENFERKF